MKSIHDANLVGLPKRIGNYRIEERLGTGGMGAVYRAFDEALQRPLAIKHLLPERSSPNALLRFRREAQAAARLNHPAIVHIYEIVETEKGDWIVMELVPGTTVERALRAGTLDLPLIVRIGREVAEGLAEAHAHGIIHRDLKAANVMVTPAGRAKILDFGIAKLAVEGEEAELSQTGIVLGTYHAMSPEQAQGQPLDHRSDLFSLGSLLYEMLTGTSPFRGANPAETLTRVCTLQPSPVGQLSPEVPRELSDLVGRLLRKQPAKRPQSAREVAALLEEVERPLRPAASAGRSDWGTESSWNDTLVDGVAGRAGLPTGGSAAGPRESRSVATPAASSLPGSGASFGGTTLGTSERRQVTVVCCELVAAEGAPEGAAGGRALDPEVLHELMAEVRALTAAATGRYDGHLGGILGQRVLIYFGFPQAHEDNAVRAVRAALELVEQVGRLKPAARRAGRLALRAGIHTGPAVVATSPHSQEPVTLGPTLDLAVELQALAAPGAVIVSPATGLLVEKGFALEALPPMRPAGFAAELVPQRVLAARGAVEDTGAALAPLLGRERELELLLARWELAREGRGQAVLVSGEPGIGKSHLASWLRQRVREEGGAARWLSCFGSPYARNSPLQPLVGPLRQVLAPLPGVSPRAQLASALADLGLAETTPLLAALLDLPEEPAVDPMGPGERPAPGELKPGERPAPALSPERLRERTLEALVALVLAMAERQPVVLLIEDLHWLDPSTLNWLDRLLEQAPAAALLLVLTVRPDTLEALWGPRAHLTHIGLAPLAAVEAERLIAEVEKKRSLPALPAAIRRRIVARADGVPLFVEELTRAVLESGVGESRDLPATLRDSLAARLDRLGAAKEIAQLASVIGRLFSFELLAAVSLHDEVALQEELRQLIKAELIHRKGVGGFGRGTQYLFRHALVRDAAYETLLTRERQALHLRIAETLRNRFAETCETQPELLAYHYTEGGLAEPALEFWQRAGELASSRSASLEAIHHFEQALGLLAELTEGPRRDRRELALQNGLAAATLTGRGFVDPAVERAYARAELLAQRLEETDERFWAVVGLHTYHLALGDYARAQELVERLQTIAAASGSPSLLSIACFWLGTYSYYLADFARALPELERAYELAPPDDTTYRQRTAMDLRVLALGFSALVLWHLGFPDRARRRGEQAAALARELDHPYSLAFARGLGGAGLGQFLRDVETVRREARAVHELAVEMDFSLWIWQATFLLVWADLVDGSHAGGGPARSTGGPVPDLGPYASVETIEQLAGGSMDYYFCLYAEILALRGQAGEALRAIEQALPKVAAMAGSVWHGELYRLQGEILGAGGPGGPGGANAAAETETEKDMESLFLKSIDLARAAGARVLELRAAVSLGRLWRRQGREAEARGLVADVHTGFTEGFETWDLRQARGFLDTTAVAP